MTNPFLYKNVSFIYRFPHLNNTSKAFSDKIFKLQYASTHYRIKRTHYIIKCEHKYKMRKERTKLIPKEILVTLNNSNIKIKQKYNKVVIKAVKCVNVDSTAKQNNILKKITFRKIIYDKTKMETVECTMLLRG